MSAQQLLKLSDLSIHANSEQHQSLQSLQVGEELTADSHLFSLPFAEHLQSQNLVIIASSTQERATRLKQRVKEDYEHCPVIQVITHDVDGVDSMLFVDERQKVLFNYYGDSAMEKLPVLTAVMSMVYDSY